MTPASIRLLWLADPAIAFDQILARLGPARISAVLLDAGVLPYSDGKLDLDSIQAQLCSDGLAEGMQRIGILLAKPSSN